MEADKSPDRMDTAVMAIARLVLGSLLVWLGTEVVRKVLTEIQADHETASAARAALVVIPGEDTPP